MTEYPPPPCTHRGNTARKTWIIVRKPGCVPTTKQPSDQSWSGVESFLRDLINHTPEGTNFTLATLSYGYDLWVEDGLEYLSMGEMMRSLYASAPTCTEGAEI